MVFVIKEKYNAIDNLIAETISEITPAIEELEKKKEDLEYQLALNLISLSIIKDFSQVKIEDNKVNFTRSIVLGSSVNDDIIMATDLVKDKKISAKDIENYINSHISPNRIELIYLGKDDMYHHYIRITAKLV